jgi:hypothetical protein
MTAPRAETPREALSMIAADMEAHAREFDGQPFAVPEYHAGHATDEGGTHHWYVGCSTAQVRPMAASPVVAAQPAASDPALQALLDRATRPLDAYQVGWGWLTAAVALRRPVWQIEAGVAAVNLRVDQLTPRFVAGGAR